MTKRHSGILVNVNYQLNKQYTFTNQIRTILDNITVRTNKQKEIKINY
jgi:hypothetical protein